MTKLTGQQAGAPRRWVKVVACALYVTLLIGVAETMFALLPRLAGEQFRSVVYFPPTISRATFENYLMIRDPIVGWPSPGRPGEPGTRRIAPRPSPANRAMRSTCVSLYGDSFVFGDEVGDEDAWGNVLAGKLACRVENFGIGGYGTDQALLRFKANAGDRAPVTVLGIFADNLMRNVNQYRYFLTGGESLALKPRFVLEGGTLRLVPMADPSYDRFVDGLRRPESLWQHEIFLPDSRHGPVRWSFPYTWSAFQLAINERVLNFLRGRPSWIGFLDPDHDSRALPTTVAIAEEFARAARTRDQAVLVVLFPSPTGYDRSRRTGTSAYSGLAAALEARGLAVHDLTTDFAAHLGERSFCTILSRPEICYGHYNPEGNGLVAATVHDRLRAAGLVVAVPDRR